LLGAVLVLPQKAYLITPNDDFGLMKILNER